MIKMEVKEIKPYDLKNLSNLYEEFKKDFSYKPNEYEHFFEYVNRCPVCGEICFSDDMQSRTFNGINGNMTERCCLNCQQEIDSNKRLEENYDETICSEYEYGE